MRGIVLPTKITKKNNKSDTRNLNEDIKILVKGFKEIQIVLPNETNS